MAVRIMQMILFLSKLQQLSCYFKILSIFVDFEKCISIETKLCKRILVANNLKIIL